MCSTKLTDGIKNGAETDVDCGGKKCSKCTTGKACRGPTDCASNPSLTVE